MFDEDLPYPVQVMEKCIIRTAVGVHAHCTSGAQNSKDYTTKRALPPSLSFPHPTFPSLRSLKGNSLENKFKLTNREDSRGRGSKFRNLVGQAFSTAHLFLVWRVKPRNVHCQVYAQGTEKRGLKLLTLGLFVVVV